MVSIDEQLTKLTDTYENIELLASIRERFNDQLTQSELAALSEAMDTLGDVASELWAEIKGRATWPPAFSFGSTCKEPEEK